MYERILQILNFYILLKINAFNITQELSPSKICEKRNVWEDIFQKYYFSYLSHAIKIV